MSTEDISLRILVDIREQTQATNLRVDQIAQQLDGVEQKVDRVEQRLDRVEQKVDGVEQKLDRVEQRLDGRIDALEQRLDGRIDALEATLNRKILESEIRTATMITEFVGTLHDVSDTFRSHFELHERVARCERHIEELRHRAG